MTKLKLPKDFLNTLLRSRKFTVPFSVLVAIVFWMVITISQNPQREATFSGLSVSIVTTNTALEQLGLDVIGKAGSEVSVVVSGPTYIVSSLSATDLSVTANLSEVNAAGTYEIPLVANKAGTKTGYNIVSIIPEKISLTFDYISETEFPVQAVANGASAVEGLIVDTPVVTNSEDSLITVRGPRSRIEQISQLRAIANVNDVLSQTTSYDANIVAVDEAGNEIEDDLLTFSATKVKISVPIYKHKSVKLVPTFVNAPAGFSESQIPYTISYKKIDVKGTPETIDKLTEIKLAPINFYEISVENNSFDVALSMPNGIKVIDNIEAVTVKIDTSDYTQRTFNISDCRVVNLKKGNTVENISSLRNVKVCGPKSVLRKLSATDLYAEIDLSGKAAGQYTIPVTVKSQKSDELWQVGTYTTVVVVK